MRQASAAAYVELHLHSCYSFLEGASLPEELVARAAELGYQALAITDHDGLHGAMAVRPGLRGGGHPADHRRRADAAPRAGRAPSCGPVHLTLLAETEQGYANLCRLITAGPPGAPDGRRDEPASRPLDPATSWTATPRA